MALVWVVVVGGWGTRNVCRGGDEDSERSTLTYASYASPNDASGSQAKRYEDAWKDLEHAEVKAVLVGLWLMASAELERQNLVRCLSMME